MTAQPPPIDSLAASFSASYAGVVAFIAVANEGSFVRAAEKLGVGRSAISRSVQKLEGQIGVRLFQRTTRTTSLTREGELFYENCKPGVARVVQAIEDMYELREGPLRGRLRVQAGLGFGRHVIAPLVSEFGQRHPQVSLELVLDDRPINFAGDRIDVAFLDGSLDDAQIVARRLIPMQWVVCASPAYLKERGAPTTLDSLSKHASVSEIATNGRSRSWKFHVNGQRQIYAPPSSLGFNDPALVLDQVLAGRGLAQLPAYQVAHHLSQGRLVACLGDLTPDDDGHFVAYLSREHMPNRLRQFVDFMVERVRLLDIDCSGFLARAALP
ncbi:DNA-binding transcriptional regulator, LysR family [Pseudoxanthomonas sp. GM95]|uniref:LysR family transcriptional regulator n=1 Tax=Pseudoxanthomonas sp. GM95 TaxID=1881043 RepID=UPI0008C1099D|nr:LysR family transcriptional regulator [Pseudoxanthomonas sp. GM95]SEL12206.1 DNA-binding transcriptional regulator, LysR family [Pseudoxanthomonas sp. GM95]